MNPQTAMEWCQKAQLVCGVIGGFLGILTVIATFGVNHFKSVKDRQSSAQNAMTGQLTPALHLGKQILSSEKKLYPTIQAGTRGFILRSDQNQPMFSFFDEAPFNVVVEDGQLKVSMTVRGHDAALAAQMIDNEWKISENA